ncbi:MULTISPECIES: Eco57I restriction-modification methylase domain-containing protein [Vibrio]|uniref:Eco57I restriction-modification methylase domain-containing protein n=2 Tax=Vibrionaceae TaxID=641 RepID=UPI0000D53FCE|nr:MULTISPECIES: N-6 DNA methylase [Vibrio]EAS76856.1 type II restriction enzyme, methylase subunit [Vibrio alginolyticus 12G01]EHD0131659.1 N-6 DNA methylase [Vibrio alginolyticus]KPM86715.1 restriction endonuclease subunit M [Vibrio alginolyticus]KPM95321.1 restriction endonuclease subunit M [Vibrio alginolyticus]MCR9345181.1 BREX-1 system adenine-specific DNA-methyltransferase PglX [Vibrio alginolyticus]
MRQALDKTLRKKLEDTVVKARDIVEQAVFEALQRLGVAEAQAPSYLSEEERVLRNKLRAHARQLGDKLKDGKQETERLINEMAYEHWHRMLFARYLEQNNLLMYDEYTPVTLDECFELAEEEPDCKDGWELAGRLAQKMLPQIFRVDSPVFDIKLSMNRVEELESLIAQLDPQTYQAQDSLGWCYQFWQTKKKDQVNKSGVKIGAQELSPVTQLFTEPYMVSFLLDNALGAWWANKRLSQDDLIRANNEQELRELAAIPGVSLEYLRFSKEEGAESWKPAAGGFEKWPENLSELKTLDPCCGSGHFLVAVFLMLVPMRMQLEGLSEKQAVDAVLRDNIHGLELDQRCVELAAFALALEAWRYPNAGGYRVLPELQLACSGMSIAEAQKEWKDLAKGDEALTDAITWMQHTFKDAPTLGSLISPNKALEREQSPPWELLQNVLITKTEASSDAKTVAQGLAKAAGILAGKYQWVVTNVPYLANNKFSDVLKEFSSEYYPNSKADLANIFIDRTLELLVESGTSQLVTPQNWLFLSSFRNQRRELLTNVTLSYLARLGTGAFDTISGEVVNVALVSFCKHPVAPYSILTGLDVSNFNSTEEKSLHLTKEQNLRVEHKTLLDGSGYKINFESQSDLEELSESATSNLGICSGDYPRFGRFFWECVYDDEMWAYQNTSVKSSTHFDGNSNIFLWEKGNGAFLTFLEERLGEKGIYSWLRGENAWGKKGITVSATGSLPVSLYNGQLFDNNVSVLIPNEPSLVSALWCFCASGDFTREVRSRNQQLKITDQSFVEIPCDLSHWKGIANQQYPNGLPLPYSNDPTQWLFHGHPCASVIWDDESKTTAVGTLRQDETVLQVSVARLLGYQWPAELDPEMELAPEMREVMKKNADFAGLIDDDGIVCIPAVRGEKTAAKRLEAILYKAYGDEWTSSVEQNLLNAVKAKALESWLRDKFFDQHCKLFQHRPFIWQVWDGLKDGFSALVNYHKLDYKGLERLIYTYLDDWISTQKRDLADGKDGADIRLTAAENLKKQLEAILAGEKGLDIFVRWKPLEEQPIGWNPDLNDGVRLNIRPFMLAKDVGKKGAGVLRGKPNIHWKKDRGTDVASAPWFDLGPVYGEKEGSRINDHHLTLAEKKAAREQAND